MNAYKFRTTLGKDGTLTLEGLPFSSGELVEVIVLEADPLAPTAGSSNGQRTPERALDTDYLSAVSSTMTEWASEADELAYRDL